MTTAKNDPSVSLNDEPKLHKQVKRQIAITATGEILAFSLAIGAVYASEKLLPKQTEAFVSGLAERMAIWRGASAQSQKIFAKKILDVGIMNIAGATGMAAQFGIRRAHQKEGEKTSFWYEAGRLATGRLFGTLTAISTLGLMEARLPGFMRKAENNIAEKLGGSASNKRFSELLIGNAVQTVGGIAGNAPAQLLYDHLVNPPHKKAGKSTPG